MRFIRKIHAAPSARDIVSILGSTLLVAAIFAACSGDREEPSADTLAGRSDTSGASASGDNSSSGGDTLRITHSDVETIQDTMMLEGTPQPVTLTRVSTALPFTTYYPANEMRVDETSSGEGGQARFVANFAGKLNEDAYLMIFFPATRIGADELRTWVEGKGRLMSSNGWKVTGEPAASGYPWAKHVWTYTDERSKTNAGGRIVLGEQGGSAFYIVEHRPAEYAEGFGPRTALILEHLRVK